MIWLVLLLIFTAGYATQRGSVCAVAAIEDLVLERRTGRFVAFLFCASCSLFVMGLGALFGRDSIAYHRGSALPLLSIAGGLVLGAGVWLNGRCAFGTVAKLGSGDLPRLGTLLGFLAGVLLSLRTGVQAPTATVVSPLVGVAPAFLTLAAGTVSAALVLWLLRSSTNEAWSPLRTMFVIGSINGVLLVLAASWPYTNLLMDLAASTGADVALRTGMSLVFVGGALAAALAAHRFRLNWGDRDIWLRSLSGGTLMGFGASLVPGGNDTMLLVGLPLLLPSYILAYAAMIVVLLLFAVIARMRVNNPSIPAH